VRAKLLRGLTMLVAVVFGMGPTVGDIGSCGQPVELLDGPTFFEVKASIDCRRCSECGLAGTLCDRVCQGPEVSSFPPRCQPLVHDGEVCLHALLYAPCEDYASYMNEAGPMAPSECQFCPRR
jgi:hypothetical protein